MNRLAFALAALLVSVSVHAGPKKPTAARPLADSMTRAAACQVRFEALCSAVHSCVQGAADDTGARCEAIDPGCDKLGGAIVFTRGQLAACVSGLRRLTCETKLDPMDPAALDLESRVPACKAIVVAEAELEQQQARAAKTATASR